MDETNTEETRWQMSQPKPMTQQEYNLARLEAAEGLRPYPDLPKPATGEWTVETCGNEMKRIMCGSEKVIGWTMRPFSESFQKIVDAHKNALDTARIHSSTTLGIDKLESQVTELEKQLAAERGKFKELEQLYRENNQDHYREVGELRRQLAAEKEIGHNQAVTLGQHIARLEYQLAAVKP